MVSYFSNNHNFFTNSQFFLCCSYFLYEDITRPISLLAFSMFVDNTNLFKLDTLSPPTILPVLLLLLLILDNKETLFLLNLVFDLSYKIVLGTLYTEQFV